MPNTKQIKEEISRGVDELIEAASKRDLMWGIKYQYSDQYGSEDHYLPYIFTTRELAEEWKEGQVSHSYLVIVGFQVDPKGWS